MTVALIICGWVGPGQAILIIIALLLLFGGKKIPELMRGLGQGMREFKKATREDDKEEEELKKDK